MTIGMDDTESRILARLAWKDLTVIANGHGKLLHDLSGTAEPRRLLALLGPSGSGKSTMLDTLAGRLTKNAIWTGDILCNGHKTKLSYGTAAYLPQESFLVGTLTVFETIWFSAKLRFPRSTSNNTLLKLVNDVITDVGLQKAVDNHIGTWFKRGLSGGEKRRVSIALELLTRPPVLFLDEPTSGLDSASSYHVIRTIKKLARDGCTVICSIHQPNSETFSQFDDVCLLSGGKQVYFGSVPGAVDFFGDCGHPCPSFRNPSDHFLMCVNSDFDEVYELLKSTSKKIRHQESDVEREGNPLFESHASTKETVNTLTSAFAISNEKIAINKAIETMINQSGQQLAHKGSQADFMTQSLYLIIRSFINMFRDAAYYGVRLAMYMVISICLATIYHNIGQEYTSIQARAACITFVVSFLTFMSLAGFPSFLEDLKVFRQERQNGYYGVGAFVLGNTLSSAPFLLLIAASSSLIAYFVIDFHSGANQFLYFVVTLTGCLLVAESLMMTVAVLTPNFLVGMVIGAGIQGLMILVAGFFRLPDELPKPVWRYPLSYLAFHHYANQGFMQNDFLGLNFENLNASDPSLTGTYVLKYLYQVDLSVSKWVNTAIIYAWIVIYRILFYILVRYSESISFSLRAAISSKFYSPRRLQTNDLHFPQRDSDSPILENCQTQQPISYVTL